MARTKFTGPKPESPTEVPPVTGAAHDGAPNPPTAAIGAPAPASAAKPQAPGQARITKRARGTAKSTFPKEVLILYEALTYGVDVKVDHAAVARAAGINTPAARMRFTRLMKKIEASYKNGEEKDGDQEDAETKGDASGKDCESGEHAGKEDN